MRPLSGRDAELEALLHAVAAERDGLRARVADLIAAPETAPAAGADADPEPLAADSAELDQLQVRLAAAESERDGVRAQVVELQQAASDRTDLEGRLATAELEREELRRTLAELAAAPVTAGFDTCVRRERTSSLRPLAGRLPAARGQWPRTAARRSRRGRGLLQAARRGPTRFLAARELRSRLRLSRGGLARTRIARWRSTPASTSATST